MSVVIPPMMPGIGEDQISFFNIDRIFDFLLSIGMKPFVELGFMWWNVASIQHFRFDDTSFGKSLNNL